MNEAPAEKPKLAGNFDGPGYWINTDMLDRIRKCFERPVKHLAVYSTVNCMAADRHSKSFEAEYLEIGKLCGCGADLVRWSLLGLNNAKVVQIEPSDALGTKGAKITLLGEVKL